MRTASILTAVSTALALAGLLAACGKSPTSPSPTSPPATGPSAGPSGGPTIYGHEFVGPRAVAPGETAQFSLIAYLTDGSKRDVTKEASWSASPASVLSIVGPGLATGLERGEGEIRATNASGNSYWTEVMVVPAGTYRLAGLVSETGFPSATVAGARIEVTTGAGAGLFTTTSTHGGYRLYGVSGTTNIRVTKDGYQPQARTITVTDHQNLDIELPLSVPRDDRSGTYTLTITAADDCRVGLDEGHLPQEARVRTYTATVSQRGPELEVVLSGARFIVYDMTGDRFRGRAEPGGAVFSLSFEGDDYSGFYPNLVEQLTTSTVFVLEGTVVAAGPTDRLAGMLDGTFYVAIDWFPRPALGWRPIAWCSSASHQFVLSR